MKDLEPIFDGDHGPIIQMTLKDQGILRDTTAMAIEVKIEDGNKQLITTVPAILESPKANGIVTIYLPGKATDWSGLGANLLLTPKYYMATDAIGNPATNLLLNPSFDVDANVNGIADSWTLTGAQTAQWSVIGTDVAPPVIFGLVQRTEHATTSEPDFLSQTAAVSLVAGDRISAGVWHRTDGTGGSAGNTHALLLRPGAQADTAFQFRVGTNEWYFTYGTVVVATTEANATTTVDCRGTTLKNRFDEAFMFKGEWRIRHGETMRLPIQRRSRPPKTGGDSMFSAGEFEFDSNNDGIPDGWYKAGNQNVYAMEGRTAYVNSASGSRSSTKVTLGNGTVESLKFISRGKFLVGETWTMSIKYFIETNLTGSPSAGTFGETLASQQFDGSAIESNASSNFQTTVTGGWLTKTVSLTLAANHNALECLIKLNGTSGTLWLDDAKLTRA